MLSLCDVCCPVSHPAAFPTQTTITITSKVAERLAAGRRPTCPSGQLTLAQLDVCTGAERASQSGHTSLGRAAMMLIDLMSLAVLGPAWHLAGRAAQRLQLPAITGIMLVRCQC